MPSENNCGICETTLKDKDVLKLQMIESTDPSLSTLKTRIRCPQSMGGGGDEKVPGPPDAKLKFEDLDASEVRNDNNAETSEERHQPQHLPSFRFDSKRTEDAPHIERDHEGQELPGMELDIMQGNPTEV